MKPSYVSVLPIPSTHKGHTMASYTVYRTVQYSVQVEADSEEDAIEQSKEYSEDDFAFVNEVELVAELD